MASKDPKNQPDNNGQSENEEPDGLTAEQAAEVTPYDEVEVWRKSKNTLYSVLGIIALTVAATSFYNNSKESEFAEKNIRFLNATMGGSSSKEQFLSFAEDYDDALGGWLNIVQLQSVMKRVVIRVSPSYCQSIGKRSA